MNNSLERDGEPKFRNLGISPRLLEILTKKNFITPTPIQHQVIPVALEGKDVVGIAQTGTGKTLAFGIPLLERLAAYKGQGLVLLPTRELALQVNEVLEQIGGSLGLRTAVLIGGAPMHGQLQKLRRNPHVVIATPGRLMDHMQQRNFSLERLTMIILDEADRMLDIGFQKEITGILKDAPRDRQTMLFSATMPQSIATLAGKYMRLPLRIEVAPQGTSAKNVEQEIFIVNKAAKMQLLDKLLAENKDKTLVFSRTKHGAKRITADVRAMGHSAAEIHSNRSLSQRQAALGGFKSGKYRVLVATDIAARGIDVHDISLVINFDLPDNSEDYVHRIGRTGRAGRVGRAVSFATPQERASIYQIQRLMRKTIPILALPPLPAPRPKSAHDADERFEYAPRGGRRRGNSRSRSPYRGGGGQGRPRQEKKRPGNFRE